MQVIVDPLLCEANGRCVAVAPEVFALDDDEILHISTPSGPVDPERITRAVAACPLSALTVAPVTAPDSDA